MLGIIYSIIAGTAMTLQGVFNTRLGDKIGLFESNLLVQGSAFLLSIIAWIVLGNGHFLASREVSRIYLTGGILGIIITITVMLGIKGLSPSVSISIILISQLILAVLIDAFGLFGNEKIAMHWQQILGAFLMISGIILFKLKIK